MYTGGDVDEALTFLRFNLLARVVMVDLDLCFFNFTHFDSKIILRILKNSTSCKQRGFQAWCFQTNVVICKFYKCEVCICKVYIFKSHLYISILQTTSSLNHKPKTSYMGTWVYVILVIHGS